MKKLIVALVLATVAVSASADGFRGHRDYRHDYRRDRYSTNHWVAPLVIGGLIGYSMNRPIRDLPPSRPATVYIDRQQCERIIYLDRYNNVVREEQRCN